MNLLKIASWSLSVFLILGTLLLPARAQSYSPYYDYGYSQNTITGNPMVRATVLGAGVGAAVGAIANGNDRAHGAVKGALIGGGAGLAYGYLRKKGYLNNGILGNLGSFSNPFSSNAYYPSSNTYTGYRFPF